MPVSRHTHLGKHDQLDALLSGISDKGLNEPEITSLVAWQMIELNRRDT